MSDKVHKRYFELRFDADKRQISGVAIRYGDVAEFPWGGSERFEAGAFGDMASVDAVMNIQHDRGRPVARTGGGGMDLIDTAESLRLTATMIDTRDANDAMELVRGGVLRGLSIEFRELDGQWDRKDPNMRIIREAELLGVAIVDRPAYPQSTIDRMRARAGMDERIQELEARVAELESQVEERTAERDDAIKARGVAEAAQQQAETERDEARTELDGVRGDIEARATKRADMIVEFRSLLPDDFQFGGKTEHSILVAACGDEVADAESRSTGYLRAKAEGIIERRSIGDPKPAPEPVKPLAWSGATARR